jgi:hypothetical protein
MEKGVVPPKAFLRSRTVQATSSGEQCELTSFTTTNANYDYVQVDRVSAAQAFRMDFGVAANQAASILLSKWPRDNDRIDNTEEYEITLGGAGDTQSTIRRSKQGKDLAVAKETNLLDRATLSYFSIEYENGRIRVFKSPPPPGVCDATPAAGAAVPKACAVVEPSLLMEWTDPSPLFGGASKRTNLYIFASTGESSTAAAASGTSANTGAGTDSDGAWCFEDVISYDIPHMQLVLAKDTGTTATSASAAAAAAAELGDETISELLSSSPSKIVRVDCPECSAGRTTVYAVPPRIHYIFSVAKYLH